jgi:hypothetical protein
MSTTFVGVEIGGVRGRPRHAAVVLQRRKGVVELRHWSSGIVTDEGLLDYLAAVAGSSGVIAVHGDAETAAEVLKRIWRVMDYRLLFALAPRHRTRALVRVEPSEVHRAFAGGDEALSVNVLDSLRLLVPSVDFQSLVRCLKGLPPRKRTQPQVHATLGAALSAYAALWCWWHGPAGYDVLGANSENYRLAPRMMDYEPDIDSSKF